MRLRWPLVGRAAEIPRIRNAVTAPDLRGAVVSGPAGIGKSRAVREALHGGRPHWVVGTTAARQLPLGAFAAWASDPDGDRLQLVRGVIDAVTATPTGAPALIVVDDAHLLDDLSAFVLHQIAQRGSGRVVLTVRDGEPVPDSVREIWKDHPFDRLQLRALDQRENTELLGAALGGPIDSAAAQRFWDLTRGNALYLRNIVEQELADGRLELRDGRWQWLGQPVLPTGLVELIESRFRDLTPAVGEVIDALAVAEPLELSILQSITSSDAVEEANVRELVVLQDTADGVQARVAHPLYGELRRARTPVATLRRLRGLIATELAAGSRADDLRVAVRRATLSVDSDLPADPALLLTATRGAIRLADLTLAERLARVAEQNGAGPEAAYLRAHALSWLFCGQEAEDVLAEVDTTGLPDTERARFAHLRASNLLWALQRPAEAKAHVDAVAATLNAEGRAWLNAFLTTYWFAMDDPAEAETIARSLDLAALPDVVGAETAWALATVAAEAGRTDTALDFVESGLRTSTHSFDTPHIRFNLADSEVTALALAGRIADAAQVAERVQLEAVDLPGVAHSLGPAIAARAALAGGRLDTAGSLFEQISAVMAGHATGWGYRYSVAWATTMAMRGAGDEAAAILDRLDALQRPFRSLDHERSVSRAWVSAAQGAVNEAIGILNNTAATAARKGQFGVEVLCRQIATQFGDRTHADRLVELTRLVDGPRAGLAVRFAEALRAGDAVRLSSLADEFEKMGDTVAAADAAAHAAIIHRTANRRGSFLSCAGRAEALASESGVRTPALDQVKEPIVLTAREREVVSVLAGTMPLPSNRDIADRLTLSVRTVEGHILRAMAKTGTTTRTELAELFSRRRP
ncbi:AAA family ATPase [Mycobacterium sp. NPDC003323]